ncbi:hypothetical protein ACF0H5_022759 [Mactra antiquata]
MCVHLVNMKVYCQNLLLYFGLLFSLLFEFVSSNPNEYSDRLPDKPFPFPITIHGKNVTCVNETKHIPGLYPAQTWTCEDMRVDGRRLAYGYNPSITKDKMCGETQGFDELSEVCRDLMRQMEAKKELWAAFVTNATCEYIDEPRYMLNFKGSGTYTWFSMDKGNGWIYTLRCMAVP